MKKFHVYEFAFLKARSNVSMEAWKAQLHVNMQGTLA